MKPKCFKKLVNSYKTLSDENLEFNLRHLKHQLRIIQAGITFEQRYWNKGHLLTDKAILRDRHKELIFDIEAELKNRGRKIRKFG